MFQAEANTLAGYPVKHICEPVDSYHVSAAIERRNMILEVMVGTKGKAGILS
jgi:hypothetical protein